MSLSNPFYHVHNPTFTSVLSLRSLSKSVLPCSLSHLYIRPTRTFLSPFYTSVLLCSLSHLKRRPTRTFLNPFNTSVLLCSLSRLDTRLNRSLFNSFYHQSFLLVLPCTLYHHYNSPTRSFSNPFYHIHYQTFTSVPPGVFLIRSTIFIIPTLH